MTTHLLVAPPATGKTQACLEHLRAALGERPFAPAWVLVPDKTQADQMRTRLAGTGTVLAAHVATFSDLHLEILEKAGRVLPMAGSVMLHRLLQEVIHGLGQAGMMTYYGGISALPGFLLEIQSRIGELKRALVTPERLAQAAQSGTYPGLVELARIYAAYQSRLQELNWADEEGLSWLAQAALKDDKTLLADLAILIVDGFDSFTPAQLNTLQALAGRAAETWITLPGTPDMQRPAHRRFRPVLEALRTGGETALETLAGPPHLPPTLRHLEAGLFETTLQTAPNGSDLALIEARSPVEEAREALRWIKARIVRDRVPLAGCGVALPELETYRSPLQAAANEFGLPLRFSQGALLAATPAAAALSDLLGLALNDFPRRALLDTIRSPYFDPASASLQREDARLLEIASRYGQVVQGLAQWEETLNLLASQNQDQEAAAEIAGEEESGVPRLPVGSEAARLLAGLRTLAGRLAPPDGELPLKEWVRWLAELLQDLGFYKCLAGEAGLVVTYDRMLMALAGSEALTGPVPVRYAGFLKEWQGLEAAAWVLDDERDAPPAVRVMGLMEARGVRLEALAVLDLAESAFPAVERADPFLPEDVRQALGMQTRFGQEQAGLFYQVVTRPDRFLLLTRPYLAKGGESWEPSPYWNAVLERLTLKADRIRPEDTRPLNEAASPEELLFWSSRRQSQAGLEPPQALVGPLAARWKHIAETRPILEARLQKEAGGAYDGSLAGINQELGQRYGSRSRWSASRLESYATCPFFFLASSALGLEVIEPPQLGYQANQLGSLLHAVLEHVYQEAPDPTDTVDVLARLPGVAGHIFEQAPQEYHFRPSLLWDVQQEELLKILQKTIQGIADFDPNGGWRPLAFELQFGLGDSPPLVMSMGILLHGLVDRVDVTPQGLLRIIDYKSGSSHLAPQDLINGRRLQLPIYALAAEQALQRGSAVEGFYWTLFQGKVSPLKLSTFECELGTGPQAAFDLAEFHVKTIVGLIRQGAFEPVPPQGGCPEYCPAAAWCWHFTPGRS